MKSLFNGSIIEFKKFTKSDLKLSTWKIFEMEIEERYDIVKESTYLKKLEEKAKCNEIEYNKCESISWLDSQSIMLKVIKGLEQNCCEDLLNNTVIIQEFHIPFTKKRAEYLLVFENKILIVEFSYNKFKHLDYQYQTKLNQVIGYKELIGNIVSKDIDIATYTFILHPEEEDEDSNKEEIINFIKYFNFFMKEKNVSAYEVLVRIK